MSAKVFFEARLTDDGALCDIVAHLGGRSIQMLGQGGSIREMQTLSALAKEKRAEVLPVFLGAGMGFSLAALIKEGAHPFAVIEKEEELQKLTKTRELLPKWAKEQCLWVTAASTDEVLQKLTRWQGKNGGKRLFPIVHPFYQRIDADYYGTLRQSLLASAKFDFWAKARLPRFVTQTPRLLLLTSKYFLMGEVIAACEKLNLPYQLITVTDDIGHAEFVKQVLEAVLSFKPDCAITLNHMGVDREGVLMDLLERLELPLASWFVDNPHLIIHLYTSCISPWTTLFTWDEDNIASLKKQGFAHVHYLPLGTDPERFRPQTRKAPQAWRSRVSFVGNSMLYKVGTRLKKASFPKELSLAFQKVSAAFLQTSERSVANFLQERFPDLFALFTKLSDNESKLAYETAVTWQATRVYRRELVRRLLPFHPLIAGDKGWQIEFAKEKEQPRYLRELSYYEELPLFYTAQEINFNCTSQQMKGAVNQRVFDCPAAGAFVLTDWRAQMEDLFTPKEMVCYHEPEEIGELVAYYLANPREREKIVLAARKRVLNCHTWGHRVTTMLKVLSEIYGVKKGG